MSLMHLLTMNHNLTAGNTDSPHYQLSGKSALPKFAPVGRAVSLVPVGKPALVLSKLFHATTLRRAAKPADRSSLNARLAKGDCRMVQSELSLATVRVVRNDLSDADLELVSAAGATAGTLTQNPISPQTAPPAAEPKRSILSRLKGRLTNWLRRFQRNPFEESHDS
ncbi:MAG: hypothetical protein HY300_10580 [Verrucomicrobia bacterium]|nr:hypothetical protein [Verrucomicrobiota bacterium]